MTHYKGYDVLHEDRRSASFCAKLCNDLLNAGFSYVDGVNLRLVDYAEGDRRLRHDLGFEVDEQLTLRHIAAHTTAAQYAALRADYEAALRAELEADVP